MPDVRLVTCASLPAPDPDTPHLAAALRARGLDARIDDWRDATIDWADARVTLLRSPWDYTADLDGFLRWAAHVTTVSALWNPLALIRWNTHKAYLLELQTRGAPIVPTVLLPAGSAASLDGIADAQGWNTIVVKPAVGAGARGAGRFEVGDPAGQAHLDRLLSGPHDVLVQRYLPGVEREGEVSVVAIAGEVTHAARKRPAPGDYRIHEQYGGRMERCEPSAALAALAARVCSVLPGPALYARVDLLPDDDGWRVIEVEVTEPRLFLELGPPAATARLVDAIVARLG